MGWDGSPGEVMCRACYGGNKKSQTLLKPPKRTKFVLLRKLWRKQFLPRFCKSLPGLSIRHFPSHQRCFPSSCWKSFSTCREIFASVRREYFQGLRRNICSRLQRNTGVCLGRNICLLARLLLLDHWLPSWPTRPPFTTTPPQFYVKLLGQSKISYRPQSICQRSFSTLDDSMHSWT